RAEGKPQSSVVIGKDRRIDGVEIAAFMRLHNDALIGPFVSRTGRIESGVSRESDGRSDLAEAGDGIVEQIPVAEVDDVGRPVTHVAGRGNGRGNPLGWGSEDLRAGFPLDQIFGMKRGNAASGVEDPELVLGFHDRRRIASNDATAGGLSKWQAGS